LLVILCHIWYYIYINKHTYIYIHIYIYHISIDAGGSIILQIRSQESAHDHPRD
jgi:hypothetical protein